MRVLLLAVVTVMAWAAETPEVVVDTGVAYAPGPMGRLEMDIARPKGTGRYPGVVLIHGGGFSGGKRDSMLGMAKRLAANGYVAATVSYRLTPMFQFPLPLHDVKSAVRYLRANGAKYGLDGERIGAIGVSAGATWAQFLAVTRGVAGLEGNGPNGHVSSAVDCAVSYYGRSDMRRAYEGSRNAATALPQLLGGDREAALDTHYRASPLAWVNPDSAPVLAIHGTRDQNVPFEQSLFLVERLKSVGVEAELETIAEAGHGFKGADEERAFARTLDFLNRKLKPALAEARTIVVTDHGTGAAIIGLAWPSGRVLWRRANNRATEAATLERGGVLYIEDPKGVVTELDGEQKVAWQFKMTGVNLVSAQRLANGNTLLVDDMRARVFEVRADGSTAWSVEKPEYKGLAMRRARRTAAGTTLVAVQKAGLILELDATGGVVKKWEFPGRMPAHALPLADGSVLIGLAGPGEVRKVGADGKVMTVYGGANDKARMAWTSGFAPLEGGGLLVTDYMGGRIVEFDGAGKIVHQLKHLPWSMTSVGVLR
ncbi:MAG: alpha/beta hydrolase fold domain-containing protein [Bryobacterales bacterium]|nr:alpha/beta hydrolase fold domain-containing protein [Bryobacterales bacterium]